MRALLLPACLVLLVTATAHAEPRHAASSATEELRWRFDQVLATAQTPSFRALGPERRREVVRRIASGLFDWKEMSRRALGAQWQERSAQERRTFAQWFGTLAERAYMGQVEQLSARGVPKEAVRYLDEWTDGRHALVRTSLMYPQPMPVDFLMGRRGTHWEVHDVWVDGVSAAQNYGAQVRHVASRESFPSLLDRMAARAGELAAEPRVAARR